MAAPTNPCYVKILLANSEPSTHGTSRTWCDVRVESAMRRITDIGEQPPAASINEYAPRAPWAASLSPGCQDQRRGREGVLRGFREPSGHKIRTPTVKR